MKITLTGSLGHISNPLAEALVKQGHGVTVISSNPQKKAEIEALGATAAIGSIEDVDFLTITFTGADAVYCMVPPADNSEPDRRIYYSRIANNYFQAIKKTSVKRVIHLSTYGADLDKGTGILLGAYDAENIFNQLENINLTHIRPTYFFYNLDNFINPIKYQGVIKANYGGDKVFPMVAPADIAEVIAEEIQNLDSENQVRYVSSDERSGNEIASILGTAIGKPDLQWIVISNEEVQNAYESYGMPPQLAAGFVEMFDSMDKGTLQSDFYKNHPAILGNVKIEDYAKDFAVAYNQK